MVRSLFDTALAACVQNASLIDNVGTTPYHLVRPILKRLSAKQLAQLEENSPSVTPESDELWRVLIEKDFPDRPLPRRQYVSGGDMPTKATYFQYVAERDELRASSAQRLRKFTERIQREKSRNQIVPLKGILHEPVRRKVPSTFTPFSTNARPKSILGKAMRDMQHRSLIFQGARKYDPYRAFKQRDQQTDNGQYRDRRAERTMVGKTEENEARGRNETPNSTGNMSRKKRKVDNQVPSSAPFLYFAVSSRTRSSDNGRFLAGPETTSFEEASRNAGQHITDSGAASAESERASSSTISEAAPSLTETPTTSSIQSVRKSNSTPPAASLSPSPKPASPSSSSNLPSSTEQVRREAPESYKRRPPSIFLPKRKMPRAPRISVPKGEKETKTREPQAKETKDSQGNEDVPVKRALRSSIFH
ncbi:hypothetical protein A9F13_10g02233 [Clavispora lusitaniae]|uniref:Elongin-A n=1 Tax=Clavispora lusitaniae TaxID=36911 RepID=A0AA91PZJ7_CLALS|nr:hypothetical protein A9F13_10g02233 [Clavispora lusitaniae]